MQAERPTSGMFQVVVVKQCIICLGRGFIAVIVIVTNHIYYPTSAISVERYITFIWQWKILGLHRCTIVWSFVGKVDQRCSRELGGSCSTSTSLEVLRLAPGKSSMSAAHDAAAVESCYSDAFRERLLHKVMVVEGCGPCRCSIQTASTTLPSDIWADRHTST